MNFHTEQLINTLKAMREQEKNGYIVADYLHTGGITTLTNKTKTNNNCSTIVDASCRCAVSKWANKVADVCHYRSETVSIAMNCLDRFMSTPVGQQDILTDRNLYRLAAMTALYSSVKINEEFVMDLQTVSNLSKGVHPPEEIRAMEMKLLTAIHWKVNPPTPHEFGRLILDLLLVVSSSSSSSSNQNHDCINPGEKEMIVEETISQIDTISNDYYFCTAYTASSIAFACLLNTIESNNYLATSITDDDNHNIGTALKETIFGTTILEQILDLDTTTCSIQDLRITIHEFIRKSSSTNNKKETRKNVNSSCGSATTTNRSRSSITAKRNRSNDIDTKSPRTVRI